MNPRLENREPITSGTRSNIVDIVKGIAIILMAYGHTAQGMMHREWWRGSIAVFSDTFVYSFHMPAFFFIAGLFVMSSIAKRGGGKFVTDKVKTILYPYFIFAAIGVFIEPMVRHFKQAEPAFDLKTVVLNIVSGRANWFLSVLFLSMMVALITSRMPAWLRFLAATPLGFIPGFGSQTLSLFLREFCFVAAGMCVGIRIYQLERLRTLLALGVLVIIAALQVVTVYLYGPAVLWQWPYVVLGLTGTVGLFFLAKLLNNSPSGELLAWVGRASLAIFLISPLAQGGTRLLLLAVFHTQEFWLQLLLPTFFAVLLPAIIWHQQDRWGIGWLFRWSR